MTASLVKAAALRRAFLPPLLLALLFVAAACGTATSEPQPPALDEAAEREAILAVLEGESAAFWQKDYDAWASYWLHEPRARIMGWWQAGGVTVVEGWDEIGARMKQLMAENPEPNPTAHRVRREKINLHITPTVAWVTFDQYGEDTGDERMDMPGLSRETRIFEKVDGRWKIAYAGWLLQGEPETP